jgi:hypothetical protein
LADRYNSGQALDQFPRYYQSSDNGELESLLELVHSEIDRWSLVLDQLQGYRSENQTEGQLRTMAAERGISDFPGWMSMDVKQKLWRELPRLYRGKGVAKTIEEAIRLTTGRQASVEYSWAENAFQVCSLSLGASEIGSGPPSGFPYFELGIGQIGTGTLESQDLRAAYEFVVRLTYEPNQNDLLGILWTVELLRRNVDRYRLIWPPNSQYWIVRISRLSRDTRLAPSSWDLGLGAIGSVAIGGEVTFPPVELQPIRLDKDTTLPSFNGDGLLL